MIFDETFYAKLLHNYNILDNEERDEAIKKIWLMIHNSEGGYYDDKKYDVCQALAIILHMIEEMYPDVITEGIFKS